MHFFSDFAGFRGFRPEFAGFRRVGLSKGLFNKLAVISHTKWPAGG